MDSMMRLLGCAPPSPQQQTPLSGGVAAIMRAVARLFALRCVEADLPWFIAEGELPAKVSLLCFAPRCTACSEGKESG